MSGTKTAELYRMVMEDHLCPYGLKSKHLLETQGFQVEDHHLKNHEETEAFKHKHNVETTPQTFLGGDRIGGYDDLLVYFRKEPKDKNEQTYWPVIALFSMTFLMATGSASVVEGQWLSLRRQFGNNVQIFPNVIWRRWSMLYGRRHMESHCWP